MSKKTYIIIVNYNNWQDTIICLEDLLRKNWEHYSVVVVDNGSTDDSAQKLEDYLMGNMESFITENFPSWKKNYYESATTKSNIHFIKSKENKGFASGNNIGIKYAIAQEKKDFFIWFLNNDTVVHKDSLSSLIKHFQSKNYGLIGSKILNFNPPHKIQSLYGSFNKYTGRVAERKVFKKKIAYPIGASMFTHSTIINTVGFLDEAYFLFYEELDFSTRIKNRGFLIGIEEGSIVYHKQGASTNSKKGSRKKNMNTEKYKFSGLILFYKKNMPGLKYAAYFALFIKLIKLLMTFQFSQSRVLLKTMVN